MSDPFNPEPVLPAIMTYPESLPHDLACAMSDEEVLLIRDKYALTPEEFEYICENPLFKREYTEWRQRLITEGNSFKLKLRAMAEDFLPRLHQILNSDLTAPSVKVDAFKYITKVAELEPSKDVLEGKTAASGNRITIEIANYVSPQGQPTTQTIEINAASPVDED